LLREARRALRTVSVPPQDMQPPNSTQQGSWCQAEHRAQRAAGARRTTGSRQAGQLRAKAPPPLPW